MKVIVFAILSLVSLVFFALGGYGENTTVFNVVRQFKDPKANQAEWDAGQTHEVRMMAMGCAYPACQKKPSGVYYVKWEETKGKSNYRVKRNEQFPLCAFHKQCNDDGSWPWPEGTSLFKRWGILLLTALLSGGLLTFVIFGIGSVFQRVFGRREKGSL